MLNEPDVITNKWNSTKNKFELSLFPYDTTFHNLYVQHPYAIHGSVGYHFFDWLAFETFGGYVIIRGDTQTADILKAVSNVKDFQLAGLWRTVWFGGANLLWAPIYGKFAFISEIEGSFQLYLIAGVGADGIERPNLDGSFTKSIRFTGNLGSGLRLFLTPSIAIRAELRESFGKNAFVSGEQGEITGSSWFQVGVSLFL
jgi:outer membrane beta-barrel protein